MEITKELRPTRGGGQESVWKKSITSESSLREKRRRGVGERRREGERRGRQCPGLLSIRDVMARFLATKDVRKVNNWFSSLLMGSLGTLGWKKNGEVLR